MSCGKPVEDDEEIPQVPIKKPTRCLRCKAPEVAIAIPKGPAYCQPCQFTTMDLKFKRHIASMSTAECPRDSSALVAFSEGQESSVLVSLLQNWLDNATLANERQPKHLLTSFKAVHVYDPARKSEAEALAQSFEACHQGSLTLLSLSDIFKGDQKHVISDLDALDLPSKRLQDDQRSPEEKLRSLLDPLSPTSRVSLTAQLRLQLLARYAKEKGHAALLMEQTSTRLASLTLANIALGRGWSVGEEVASVYRHSKDLIVLRPLASFLSHEMDFYAQTRLQQSKETARQSIKKDNIDGLIQDFVENLQTNFPATISTIARTSEKLGMRSNLKVTESEDVSRCALCQLPFDESAYEWPKTNSIIDLALATDNPASTAAQPGASLLAPHLCYGCLVSLSERTKAPKTMRQDVPMPVWMNDYLIAEE